MQILAEVAVPLDEDDIDSGRIFPSRFLRKPYLAGCYADYLFHDERFDTDGRNHGRHVFDQEYYRQARILVTGHNFGCGSSRESAVYALRDAGFHCVIAGSFGEIFEANCRRNNVLAISLPQGQLRQLLDLLLIRPGARVTVDVEHRRVFFPNGNRVTFRMATQKLVGSRASCTELEAAQKMLKHIEFFRRSYEERYPWL
ncbi:MAG: 3-isopropylmalate dehydratase small subunit [Burkholderiaceae bacterium]|jgi:3-isopropylmalate/(R)-2-methylmalate dehydratase small subunit